MFEYESGKRVYNSRKVICFQRGAANQTAVHIRLTEQLGSILCIAGASVEYSSVLSHRCAIVAGDESSDGFVHFLRLL